MCGDGGVATRGHGEREGPAGDKFSQARTQETVGGSGVSEANGVPTGGEFIVARS